MPAAVGVRATGAPAPANVTAGGVFSSNNTVATQQRNKPVMAGSTVAMRFDEGDMNAGAQLQGGVQYNPYQEVNAMIGEFARNMGVAPQAAAGMIQAIIRSIYQQFPA